MEWRENSRPGELWNLKGIRDLEKNGMEMEFETWRRMECKEISKPGEEWKLKGFRDLEEYGI